jgi:alpha-galactosidase
MLTLLVVTLSTLCSTAEDVQLNAAWAHAAFSDSQEQTAPEAWPFSFVYGGRPSRELLPTWERRVELEAIEGGERRTLVFTDPLTQLEVRAVATIFGDTPGVDWTIHFTNTGQSDAPVLEQVRALDASFPVEAQSSATFHSLRSTGGVDDWLPFSEPLPPGQRREFAPTAGRSSLGACPFFNLQWNGGGAMAGIGWTGQWIAAVENRNGALVLQAGMQHLHLALRPGESIRTPRILFMRWSGGDETRAHNLWRATMIGHIVPRVQGEVVTPPIAHLSTAFYEMDQCTEAIALDHLNAGKDLGFECYWYDAYYGKDNFPTVGNYVLPVERGFNTVRFPNQLKPVSEAVHAAGLKFLLWFEPERICPGTLMAIEHPEWVVLPDDGGWGMFNLALPEARAYITGYISKLIDDYGLSWVRIDNAVSYTPLWKKLDDAAGPERVGLAEIRYVEGLYQWWDELRAAHPQIAIDNCASGGGRIDLELCARAIPLWRTDATIAPLLNRDLRQAALQNQVMTAGLSRYVPFNVSGQMGADPYHFRSGFNAGISFCEDTRPADYPRELLRAAIVEGKRIRKYYFGNLYALPPVTTSAQDWCVLQYHRPAESDGMVIAFRRHESAVNGFSCALNEIDPEANYEVISSPGYTPESAYTVKGAGLKEALLKIDDAPGSLLLEYRRISASP